VPELLYLDAAATTPLCERARAAMTAALRESDGRSERASARARVASLLGVPPERLGLTPSGTAANAVAIAAGTAAASGRRIVSQPTEHPSVLAPLRRLESEGHPVTWLQVSATGRVDPRELERELARGDVGLVSIMVANHETGVIQPVAELGALCREAGALLHSDAVQGFRQDASPASLGSDLVRFSGPQLCGPKGVGGVIASERAPCLEPGDVSLPVLRGLAEALEARAGRSGGGAELAASRDALEAAILGRVAGAQRHGGDPRLPGHLCLSLPGLSGDALTLDLDRAGIAASSGAACSSGRGRPSPVLLAMGTPVERARASLRLSLWRPLTAAELDRVVRAVEASAARLRALSG
jgi:cysteine desulfurase